MRASRILLAFLGLMVVMAAAETQRKYISAEDVKSTLTEFFDLAKEEAAKAREAFSNARETVREAAEQYVAEHPDGLIAKTLGTKRRRLMTISDRVQNIQTFFQDMLGGNWASAVPARWANSSFDWSHLGDFEYSSSLGDFLATHNLASMANTTSVHDLAHNLQAIESAFCDSESFAPSVKVPATCVGPTVTIALVPKVCTLESKDKQIVCDPAKLVLVKTPGSCTHKYHSASSWVGKECKCSGSAGFSDSLVVGGAEKTIPLIDIDIGYQFKR